MRGLGVIEYANPLALVKPLKIQERELSWLTNEQIAELLTEIRRACDNPHVEIITLICLATGARWSEAEKLKPTGLRNAVITFSGTKSERSGQCLFRLSWKPRSLVIGSNTVSQIRPSLHSVELWPERPFSYRKGRRHTRFGIPSRVTLFRTAGTS